MNNEKLNGDNGYIENDNPWGDSFTNGLPPFNPNQNRETAGTENCSKKIETDDELGAFLKEAYEQRRREEAEAPYRKPINIDALINEGNAEIAKCAHAIDTHTVAIPSQEDNVANRLEQAKADYRRVRELRSAERAVLESIQDDDEKNYGREDLIARIADYQSYLSPQSANEDIRKNWRQLDQASRRLIRRLEKFEPSLSGDLSYEDTIYWQNITKGEKDLKFVSPEQLTPTTLPKEELEKLIGADMDTGAETLRPDQNKEQPAPTSYHFEAGIVDGEATVTVGQAIPDDWFRPQISGNSSDSGLGLKIEQPPRIDNYLMQALNIEYSKLSEEERRRHNYSDIAKAIKEEARRTKKIPDIVSIINRTR